MIKFDKFFLILKERDIGQNKFCRENNISNAQLDRLRNNQNIETETLNKLMNILDLESLDEICTFTKDK